MPLFLLFIFWGTLSFAQTYPCPATYAELDVVKLEVKNKDEFYFCFGYHHGKDRAWAMDYFRRSAEGRNSEVFGFDHLKSDLMMRLLNLEGHAARIWNLYPAEEKKNLEAYSRGVNEGFKLGKTAKEFVNGEYEPEAWKPVHTLEVLLLQSFDQTRKTFVSDWEQERFKSSWGNKATQLMDNDGAPWENTILKEGEYPFGRTAQRDPPSPATIIPALWSPFPEIFGKESGSNNWVVSAKKSASGKAMLANDPHLDLKTPLFWYWIHLKGNDEEVIGASLPGIPLVASGTNGHVAWGLTNAYINTADAVFLKNLPKDELETIRPLVWIKFWKFRLPFFFKSFERTKTGYPVLPLEIASGHKMFLRWTGFHLLPQDILSMLSLPSVKNVSEMNEKLKTVGVPSWNFVFADTNGDIGYRVIGNIYKQTRTSTYGMKTITYEELQSKEFLSAEERPHLLKPDRNYIYSANNRHWPVNSKFNGGRGYTFSFRGKRIDELLQSDQDVESFKRIQCDRQAVDARYFVPKILEAIAIPELQDWNYETAEFLKAPAIYRRFMDLLMQKWDVNEYGLYRLLDGTTDQMKKEMKEVYASTKVEIQGRTWGELHLLGFSHLSKKEDWDFSPEISAPGDNHTVDPGTSRWNEERKVYEHISGASMRMIIEMENRPKIHLVLPGFNRDYTVITGKNPWRDWKNCQYTRISF